MDAQGIQAKTQAGERAEDRRFEDTVSVEMEIRECVEILEGDPPLDVARRELQWFDYTMALLENWRTVPA